MQFLHNPFDKDVDLNTILYRITYPEYFEDSEFADEEEPDVNEVIFGQNRDLEAKLTWSYGVDCWRAIYAELDTAKKDVEEQLDKSGKATEDSLQLKNALQEKFDLCLRAKSALESAAEDARQGKPIDILILAEKSLPPGSKIYYRKASVSVWSSNSFGISIPEWASSATAGTPSATNRLSHAGDNKTDTGDSDMSIPLPADAQTQSQKHRLTTSHKNLQVSVYIIAHCLANLIDDLVADNHIPALSKASCLNDDDTLDQNTLYRYLSSRIQLPASVKERGISTRPDENTISEDGSKYTLAVMALALADFAEEARQQRWIKFPDAVGNQDDLAFMTSSGVYVSKRIYDYLHRYRKMIIVSENPDSSGEKRSAKSLKGQRQRTFLERLDSAKPFVGEEAIDPGNPSSLMAILASAADVYMEHVRKLSTNNT